MECLAMDWKKIINVHKEIVKRGEDDFFTLYYQTSGSRSSDINSFQFNSFSGPWNIKLDDINNERFSAALRAGQHDQFFIGGPILSRNNTEKTNPLIYKEVNLKLKGDQIVLSPSQSKWMISPPLVRAILSNTHVDDFDSWLKDKIEELKKRNDFSISGIINVFFDDFPFLSEQFSFNDKLNNWFLFTPPSRISPFNVNLMRDYEALENKISASPGGLDIFNKQQQIKKNSSTLLPLVNLNTEQEKAVKSFLSSDRLSVVTGPPGTGKSQVVLSALLNAWAQGKTVLFSSSNNTAVDVIKERLDEFNAGFPLYVRAGAKNRNNIDEVLQQTLMLGQAPDDIDIKKLDLKEKELTKKADELQSLIDSKKPEQITELYNSAESAYSECLKAKSLVAEEEKSLSENIYSFLKKNISYEEFLQTTELFQEWADLFRSAHTDFSTQNDELNRLELKMSSKTDEVNQILKNFNTNVKDISELAWINDSRPDAFKQMNDSLESHTNELLLEDDPGELALEIDDRWDDMSEVNNSIEVLKRIEKSINDQLSVYESSFRTLNAAEKKLEKISDQCSTEGLTNQVNIQHSYLEDWLNAWGDFQTTPKTFLNKLPYGLLSKIDKQLVALEQLFRKAIPVKIWNNLGVLDEESRPILAEYVELLAEFTIKQNKHQTALDAYEDVKLDFLTYKDQAKLAKITNQSMPKKVDWDAFLLLITSTKDEAVKAKKYYKKIAVSLNISKKIKLVVSDIFDLRSKQPLLKQWFKSNEGREYESIINALNKTTDHRRANNFKSFYDQKLMSFVLDSWNELIKIYTDSIPTQSDIQNILASDAFKKIQKSFPSKVIPTLEIDSFNDIDKVNDFSKKIVALRDKYVFFNEEGKDQLINSSKKELERALNQLTSAAELLDDPKQDEMKALINLVKETKLDSWPQKQLEEGFADFNKYMLKARLEMIRSEIGKLAFEKTKISWFDKISKDSDLQNSISSLSRKLSSNRNVIPDNAFKDFQKSLNAIPIWISTAQSSQSIPMIPKLFDIVIMDEASQCTMTHALPLIYRGKSFAAIGDPDQLSSIPSLQQEEENAIIDSNDYDDFPDQLRHFNNNVFSASFLNLYQAGQNQIVLREHFRSHPLIIGFSNLNIYYKKHNKPLVIKNPDQYSNLQDGLSYVQVAGKSIKPSQGSGWINPDEVSAVISAIKSIKANSSNNSLSIGVVTPYKKQAELITDSLTSEGLIGGVAVGTAHVYQGQEKDIMIFSTVVSTGMDHSSAMWISKPPNVLNVAMTRAKRQLVIVGDMDYCGNNFSGEILGKLSQYCKKIQKLEKISLEQKKLFELLILNGIDPEIEYPIADMHVDFFIASQGQNLVIEVGGERHKNQKAHDESRDAALRGMNFKVLRFSARDVRETPALITNKILENIM